MKHPPRRQKGNNMETMTLFFSTKERYARAVQRLILGDGKYEMLCHGRWYESLTYGYVEFRRKKTRKKRK